MNNKINCVSVIICGYNAGKFIRLAIKSVLEQTHTDFELYLINDGSTDNTLDVMYECANEDDRIVVVTHQNIGMAESVNAVVPSTKSEIIFRLDADDVMYKSRIEEQLNYLNEHQEIYGLSCLGEYINEDNVVIGKTYSDIKSIEDCKRYIANNDLVGFLHPGFVFRKSAFLEVGGYDGRFWPTEDLDICNKFIEKGYWIITYQKILVGYRIHSGSIITSKFMESRQAYEWLRACIWARRSGAEQPTKAEFKKSQEAKSIFFKINKYRKNYSKYYYRNAGFSFANKNYFSFSTKLTLSLFLQPSLVLKKIKSQKFT